MKISIGIISTALSLATILSLGGCGGGSDSSSNESTPPATSSNLTGTVATGEGASASIEFVGAQGNHINGRSAASGLYSVNASSLTQPVMVRAILDRDGAILYSFAESTSGTVNITPLTSFVVDQAAQAAGVSGGASQLFQTYETRDNTGITNITNEIDTQTEELDSVIASQMGEDNVTEFNHFSGDFDADHTGYDALLDNLDIVVYNDDIIIREGNITLDTLDYNISVSEVNATGSVYDITTGLVMSDVNITLTDNIDENRTTTTDVNGSFTLSVDTMRTYTLTVSADGYTTQVVPNVSSFVFTQENLGSIPMFPATLDSSTNLSGKIINGRTSDTGIANVTMTFRDGYDARIGDVVVTTQTNSSGNYEITLPNGVYTAELTLDGYATVYRNVEVFGDTLIWDTSMLAQTADIATNAFATISLNWDANPSDLDSHLTGQLDENSTNRFHMYFGNRTITAYSSDTNNEEYVMSEEEQAYVDYTRTQLEAISGADLSGLATMDELYTYSSENLTAEQQEDMNNRMQEYFSQTEPEVATPVCSDGMIASLDRDRTNDYDGLLPETTTLCSVIDGSVYKYYVHQFSGTSTMSGGHAQVTLTTASGVTRTFTAPISGETGTDDIWHVFDIDSNGNIFPVNEIIGNDSSESELFASPSRVNINNQPFVTERNLVNDLPNK
jgi:hypothetical protein